MIECLVIEDITLKTPEGRQEIKKGQVIRLPEEPARQLIQKGKIRLIDESKQQPESQEVRNNEFESESLSERMAIMGENCELVQTEPFVTDFGVLVIPFNSDKKYHYWNGGQSVCDTLKELGRCDLVEKYKSPYCN